MNNIQFKRLGDLATFVNGYAFKSKDWVDKGLPIIRIQNLTKENAPYNYYDQEINDKYLVKEGDILISWSGSIGVYEWREKEALLNQHIFRVDFNKETINKTYFKYIVKISLSRAEQYLHGSTMKHMTKKYFDNIQVPVPDLSTQKKIADILSISENLISKREEQIEDLLKLTQSTFLKMFGDPVSNPKNYPKMKISEVCASDKGAIKAGPFGSQLLVSELVTEGIPVFGIENVGINKFIFKGNKAITPEKFSRLKAFQVKKGDVLISRTGTVGRTCVLPEVNGGIIGPNLLKVTPNSKTVKPEYISHIFNYLPNIIDQIKRASPGATVAVFNTKNLKKIEILVPSIEEQISFVNLINEIEKHKTILEESLSDLVRQFNALSQTAFKGELIVSVS